MDSQAVLRDILKTLPQRFRRKTAYKISVRLITIDYIAAGRKHSPCCFFSLIARLLILTTKALEIIDKL